MKNNEPLVKGGCGHSAEDVLFSGMVSGIVFLVFLILLLTCCCCGAIL